MYDVVKKAVCTLLAAVIFTGMGEGLSVVHAKTQNEIDYATTKRIFFWNGSDETKGKIDGEFSLDIIDEEHGKSIFLNSSNGAKKMYFKSTGAEMSEMDIVSFDLYCADNNVKAITGLLMPDDAGTEKKMFYIRETGKTTVQQAMEGEKLAVQITEKARSAKMWYHLDACVDYAQRKVDYFIDGVGLGFNPLPDDYNIMSGFSYILEATNGGGVHVLDNISVIQVMERGKQINIDEGIAYPQSFTDPHILSNDRLGSIFFGKNVKFSVRAENDTDKRGSFEIGYEVINERGASEGDGIEVVSLEAGEEKNIDIAFEVNGYGFYTIEAYVKNTQSGNSKFSRKVFSVVNGPADGSMNPLMGVCNHFNQGHGVEELERKTELLKNAGFTAIREGYRWADVEKTPGVYKISDVYERTDNALKANGMKRFVNLGLSNPVVTPEFPPVSDYAVERFADYAYNIVGQTKGLVEGVEVWNEWDIKSFNPSGAPIEYYHKLQKATYEAVKKANPDCTVYGMCATTAEFMEEFFESGGGEYCDGFSWHPYPEGSMNAQQTYEKLMSWKEITKKYGYGDLPVSVTEFNWTSGFVSEDDQADYAIQYAAMTLGEVDAIYWYVSQEKQTAVVREKHFGMLRAWDEAEAAPYEPYSAKPEFLALANWNALMTGAVPKGRVNLDIPELTAYKFKSRNGEDVLMIWNDDMTASPKTLKLDTDNITVYDRYGNSRNVVSDNNCFSFAVSRRPVYIFGDFENVEPADEVASCSVINLEATTNDEKTFFVTKKFDGDVKLELDLPRNITAVSIGEFENNISKIVLKTGTNPAEKEVVTVRMADAKSGAECWSCDIPVTYYEAVSSKIYATLFRSRRWNCNVKIKNHTSTRMLNGKVVFEAPGFLKGRSYEFSDLLMGEECMLKIGMPENMGDVKQEVKGKICLDSGEEYKFHETIYFTNFVEAVAEPVIDGVLKPGEWQTDAPFKLKYEDMVKRITPWTPQDCGGNIYCMWDNQYFYIAGEINDNILGDNDEKGRIWANDSIQFSFAEEDVSGAKQTEYGIGMVNGQPMVERYSYFGVIYGMIGQEDHFKGDGIDVKITRDEEKKITYYEARFPWIEIFGQPISPGRYEEFYFSLLVNDNDRNGRRGWLEFCPGIGETKDTAAFKSIPVTRKNVW